MPGKSRAGDGTFRPTHGQSRTSEYRIWTHMKDRCLNPNHRAYARYGGRGITIHPSWLASFEAFLADVGPRPGPGYSIDRIDNDGNYEPGNVRWATAREQSNNRRQAGRELTHCPNDHEYDEANTYYTPVGWRRCVQASRDAG